MATTKKPTQGKQNDDNSLHWNQIRDNAATSSRNAGKPTQSSTKTNTANTQGRSQQSQHGGTNTSTSKPASSSVKNSGAAQAVPLPSLRQSLTEPKTSLQAVAATAAKLGVNMAPPTSGTGFQTLPKQMTALNGMTPMESLQAQAFLKNAPNQSAAELRSTAARLDDNSAARQGMMDTAGFIRNLSPYDQKLPDEQRTAIVQQKNVWNQAQDYIGDLKQWKSQLSSYGEDTAWIDAEIDRAKAWQARAHDIADANRAYSGYTGGKSGDEFHKWNLSPAYTNVASDDAHWESTARAAAGNDTFDIDAYRGQGVDREKWVDPTWQLKDAMANEEAYAEYLRRMGDGEAADRLMQDVRETAEAQRVPTWDERAQNLMTSAANRVGGSLLSFGSLAAQATENMSANTARGGRASQLKTSLDDASKRLRHAQNSGNEAEIAKWQGEVDRLNTLLYGGEKYGEDGHLTKEYLYHPYADSPGVSEQGHALLEKSRRQLMQAQRGLGGIGQFAMETAGVGLENIPTMGLYALNPVAGAAYMAATVLGEKGDEFSRDEFGAPVYSAQQALLKAAPYAAVETATEALGDSAILDFISKRGSLGLSGIVARAALTEGAEEGAAGILDYGLDYAYGNPEVRNQTAGQVAGDIFKQAVQGGIVGAVMGAGGAFAADAIGSSEQQLDPEWWKNVDTSYNLPMGQRWSPENLVSDEAARMDYLDYLTGESARAYAQGVGSNPGQPVRYDPRTWGDSVNKLVDMYRRGGLSYQEWRDLAKDDDTISLLADTAERDMPVISNDSIEAAANSKVEWLQQVVGELANIQAEYRGDRPARGSATNETMEAAGNVLDTARKNSRIGVSKSGMADDLIRAAGGTVEEQNTPASIDDVARRAAELQEQTDETVDVRSMAQKKAAPAQLRQAEQEEADESVDVRGMARKVENKLKQTDMRALAKEHMPDMPQNIEDEVVRQLEDFARARGDMQHMDTTDGRLKSLVEQTHRQVMEEVDAQKQSLSDMIAKDNPVLTAEQVSELVESASDMMPHTRNKDIVKKLKPKIGKMVKASEKSKPKAEGSENTQFAPIPESSDKPLITYSTKDGKHTVEVRKFEGKASAGDVVSYDPHVRKDGKQHYYSVIGDTNLGTTEGALWVKDNLNPDSDGHEFTIPKSKITMIMSASDAAVLFGTENKSKQETAEPTQTASTRDAVVSAIKAEYPAITDDSISAVMESVSDDMLEQYPADELVKMLKPGIDMLVQQGEQENIREPKIEERTEEKAQNVPNLTLRSGISEEEVNRNMETIRAAAGELGIEQEPSSETEGPFIRDLYRRAGQFTGTHFKSMSTSVRSEIEGVYAEVLEAYDTMLKRGVNRTETIKKRLAPAAKAIEKAQKAEQQDRRIVDLHEYMRRNALNLTESDMHEYADLDEIRARYRDSKRLKLREADYTRDASGNKVYHTGAAIDKKGHHTPNVDTYWEELARQFSDVPAVSSWIGRVERNDATMIEAIIAINNSIWSSKDNFVSAETILSNLVEDYIASSEFIDKFGDMYGYRDGEELPFDKAPSAQKQKPRRKKNAPAPKKAEGKPGLVVDDYVLANVSRALQNRLDAAAKALGLVVKFVDRIVVDEKTGAEANAQIDGRTVLIEKGNENPLMFLFGHELTHHLQNVAPDAYGRMKKYFKSQDGFKEKLREMKAAYREKGISASDAYLEDEVVADMAGELIDNEDLLQRFIRANKKKNQNVLQQMWSWLRGLIAKLGSNGRIKEVDRACRLIEDALDEAVRAELKPGGADRFSAKKNKKAAPAAKEESSIKDQIAQHADELNSMEVVDRRTVPTNLAKKDEAAKWAFGILDRIGYEVDRYGFGKIYFDKRSIDKGLRYADTPEEKAAIIFLPKVLKRGIEIGTHDNHKDREKATITFAAPVEMNGIRGNVAVVVNRNGNNYYAHRIVLPNGKNFVFGNKEDAARELQRGVTENGSLANATSAASANSLADVGEKVNPLNSLKITYDKRWGVTDREVDRNEGNDQPAKTITEIVDWVQTQLGVDVASGRMSRRPKSTNGYYTPDNQGIRMRMENNLPTLTHELGHWLDDVTSRKSGGKIGDFVSSLSDEARDELVNNTDVANRYEGRRLQEMEGFAEFIREFLKSKSSAAAKLPTVYRELYNSVDARDMQRLDYLADMVNRYTTAPKDLSSGIRRQNDRVDTRTKFQQVQDRIDSLYQTWVDTNHAIELMTRETGDRAPYVAATNAAYAAHRAGAILTKNMYSLDGKTLIGPSLKHALEGAGLNMKNDQEYMDFGTYLVAKHGPERLERGRVMADERLNDDTFMNQTAYDLEQQYPHFKQAADALYSFQKDFLYGYAVESGILDRKTADEWQKMWQFYVPFQRYMRDKRGVAKSAQKGFANHVSGIYKFKGSSRDIIHPVDSVIGFVTRMTTVAVLNDTMRTITRSAKAHGLNAQWMKPVETPMTVTKAETDGFKRDVWKFLEGNLDMDAMTDAEIGLLKSGLFSLDDYIEKYSAAKPSGNIVTVYEHGKAEYWEVKDKLLLDSLASMNTKTIDGVAAMAATVTRFMTSNITGRNVVWSLMSNAPRDLFTALVFTQGKGLKGRAELIKGLKDNAVAYFTGNASNNPYYDEFLAMGGGQVTSWNADINNAQKIQKQMNRQVTGLFTALDYISAAIESGPRFAEFQLLRKQGYSPQDAFYGAMDITTNFSRHGNMSRQFNYFVPFFNASVQGIDKFSRWLRATDVEGTKSDRQAASVGRILAWAAGSALMAAIVYGFNNRDDDRRQEYKMLSNYTKNTYFSFNLGDGKFFTVPKPREIAVLESFFESLMDYTLGGNDKAFGEFKNYAIDQFAPPGVAPVLQGNVINGVLSDFGLLGALSAVNSNKDYLGNPIEGQSFESSDTPIKERYNSSTSRVAKWIAGIIADGPFPAELKENASPVKIDYFCKQVFGGFWKAQQLMFPVDSEGESIAGRAGKGFLEVVFGGYTKDVLYSNDVVNALYEYQTEQKRAGNEGTGNFDAEFNGKLAERYSGFYSKFYKLTKAESDADEVRDTRRNVLDMIQQFLKQAENDAFPDYIEELRRVAMDQGDKTIGDLLPQVFETKIKDASGEEHELNGMQYYELQTRYNSYYAEGVQAILANDELSAAEQAAGIATLKSDAATRAKREVLELIGAPTSAVQVSDSGAEKTVYTDKYEGYADKISTAEMAGLRMTVNAQKSYYDPYSHKAMTNSESIHKAKAIADFGLSLSKEETADLMRTMGVSEGIVQAYINDALDEAYNGLEEGYRRLMAEYNGGNG